MSYTQITGSGLSHKFHVSKTGFTDVDYNPVDIIDQAPPYRGSSRPTIGGNRVEQLFGSYVCDGVITFSLYLTKAEVDIFKAAYATGNTYTLVDYTGGSYTVSFDMADGFKVGQKVQTNDKYWCTFKFNKHS